MTLNSDAPAVRSGGLTFAQEEIFSLQALAPARPIQQLAYSIELSDKVNFERLFESFRRLVRENPVLRTSYAISAGEVRATVCDESRGDSLPFETEPSAHAPTAAFQAMALQPYDLSTGPLIRLGACNLPDGRALILIGIHHICADAWSLALMAKKISKYYETGATTNEVSPNQDCDLLDYVQWEREWMRSPQAIKSLRWWAARLRRFDQPLTISSAKRLNVPYIRMTLFKFGLGTTLTTQLFYQSPKLRVSIFSILLASLKYALSVLTGSRRIVVAGTAAARRAENVKLLGAHRNMVAFASDVDPQASAGTIARAVGQGVNESLDNQYVPSAVIARELCGSTGLWFYDFLRVMFQWSDGKPTLDLNLGEARTIRETSWDRFAYLDSEQRKEWVTHSAVDLDVMAEASACGIEFAIVYKIDLLERAVLERISALMKRFLEQAAVDPDAPLSLGSRAAHSAVPSERRRCD